ncbi:MAG: hypothetical protein AAF710_03680 [Planctomycetota bacterium]
MTQAPPSSDTPPCPDAVLDEWALVRRFAGPRVRSLLDQQIDDGGDLDGGFRESPRRWPDGREAAYRAAELIALRVYADRLGLEDGVPALEDAIRRALRFVRSRQRHDGQIDLSGSYSPNEAGFVIPGLAAGYRGLRRDTPGFFADVAEPLEAIIRGAAGAVVAGDAYTANHRWAAASAPLAAAHALFPDPRYLAKIEGYLADGIDCDADGFWYEERSPNYDGVSNQAMLILADELGRPELIDHAARNTALRLATTQPDGTADTSFSMRQDRHAAGRRTAVYRVARRVALHTGDGRFTTLTRQLADRGQIERLTHLLFDLDAHPGPLPPAAPIETRFHHHFAPRRIVRHRHDDWAVTLIADPGTHYFDTVAVPAQALDGRSTDWLCLHAGGVVVRTVRLTVGGTGAFAPMNLRALGGNRYHLHDARTGFPLSQHFRPGRPRIWRDLSHDVHADVALDRDRLTCELTAEASGSLIAWLSLVLDPGTEVDGRPIAAGETRERAGAGPMQLAAGGGRVVVEGLPASLHAPSKPLTPHIPDRLEAEAGRVVVGLRLPSRLGLVFRAG